MTTIVLADDHTLVRQGLTALLSAEPDLAVVGEAGRGDEALDAVAHLRPSVLIIDLKMPGLDGLEVIRRVTRQYPFTRTLVLSMHASAVYVTEALKSGAAGYVLKDMDIQSLVQAVREIAAGRRYLSPSVSNLVVEAYLDLDKDAALDPYETLTMRERQILRLIGEGAATAEIAGRLAISPRTVETHKTHLVRKLRLKTQADLLRYSVRRGIGSPPDK
jgi:two-component system, NarL family, response regulator NreC